MYIAKNIDGVKIKRKGELQEIALPTKRVVLEGTKKLKGVGVEICLENRELSFCKGKHAIIVSGEFGVREETESTVFLAGDKVVLDIQKGVIYIKEEGRVYGIKKNLEVYEADNMGIKWVTYEDILAVVRSMVGASYHLKCKNTVDTYISNLMFTMLMENKRVPKKETTDAEYLYRVRIKEYLSDLGLDQFEYKIEEDEQAKIVAEEAQELAEREAEIERKAEEEEERKQRERENRERELEARYQTIRQGDEDLTGIVTDGDINTVIEGILSRFEE